MNWVVVASGTATEMLVVESKLEAFGFPARTDGGNVQAWVPYQSGVDQFNVRIIVPAARAEEAIQVAMPSTSDELTSETDESPGDIEWRRIVLKYAWLCNLVTFPLGVIGLFYVLWNSKAARDAASNRLLMIGATVPALLSLLALWAWLVT